MTVERAIRYDEEHGEPRLFIPTLAAFYDWARGVSWLIIRLTIGGMLLVHGMEKVLGPGLAGTAASLAGRGIEPAVPLAAIVIFLETIGAVCVMAGLLTRIVGPMIAVELAIITFGPHGFAYAMQGNAWQYPFLWGVMFFAVSLRGGGPYSLDRLIGKEL